MLFSFDLESSSGSDWELECEVKSIGSESDPTTNIINGADVNNITSSGKTQ